MAIINNLKDFFMNKSLSNMKNILTYATLTLGSCWLLAGNVLASSPSFDCQSVEVGSIEDMVCKDDELAALDRKLADVYASARQIAVNEHPPILKAEQRGWIKGRNGCWKSADVPACVACLADAAVTRGIALAYAPFSVVDQKTQKAIARCQKALAAVPASRS